ncbi:MAG: hypothetical protein B0D92_04070 [Spirochaeta sp. LUC14_002_19_P3]|nr:MAG: hypothetical protein B0D92_04070 [Spirochaeta sp. LUC14_002_19_P3]
MKQVKTVLFLADGFEEVEAVTAADYLRRANIEVIIAGVGTKTPTGSKGITISTDLDASSLSGDFDGVILPGGMPGAVNLSNSPVVEKFCRTLMEHGKLVAAICAAPVVALERFGLLHHRKFTCYPGYEKQAKTGIFLEDRVVIDKNLITSRGPGTAGEFAIELIRYLTDTPTAEQIAGAALLKGNYRLESPK